jgi:hypothetical protein
MSLQEISSKITIINNNTVIADNHKPFFLHAVGGGFLDDIIIKLGYNYDYNNKIKDQIFNELINEKIMKSTFAKYIIYFILLILIIIIIYIFYKFNILKKINNYYKNKMNNKKYTKRRKLKVYKD